MSKKRVLLVIDGHDNDKLGEMEPHLPGLFESLNAEVVEIKEAIASAKSNPVDGVYTLGHVKINKQFLDKVSPDNTLKVVSNYGVGVDHIDLQECSGRGIAVGHTPNVLSGATADLAFALLMATARRIPEGDRYVKQEWTGPQQYALIGRDVHNATIGIIGMGRIGLELGHRASGFRMKILYHNRSRSEIAEATVGAIFCSLEDLLSESDYVVILCPHTPETENMINKERLALMKPTASLINVGRGPIVNTDDLLEALRNKTIDSAGLDVFDPEPLPLDHPLLKEPRLVAMPHRGSATVQARHEMSKLSVENLRHGLDGRPLLAQANK